MTGPVQSEELKQELDDIRIGVLAKNLETMAHDAAFESKGRPPWRMLARRVQEFINDSFAGIANPLWDPPKPHVEMDSNGHILIDANAGMGVVVALLAELFRPEGGGAENYVQTEVYHKEKGALLLQIQRLERPTPHEFRKLAENQRDTILNAIREIHKTVIALRNDPLESEATNRVCERIAEIIELTAVKSGIDLNG